jgi:hypothetical protein
LLDIKRLILSSGEQLVILILIGDAGFEPPMRASQMDLGESVVFFLHHGRPANLWYDSKRRCNVRAHSAITPERRAGNSCGMAKNPRRSPLLTVLSVARGKTG